MQTISESKRIGLASIPVVQQAPVKFFRPCLKKPFELPDMEGRDFLDLARQDGFRGPALMLVAAVIWYFIKG